MRFWGGRALLLGAIVLAVLALWTRGDEALGVVISALVPVVIILVILALLLTRSQRGSALMGGVARAGGSLARGAFRTGVAGARGSAGLLARSGAAPFVVTLRRFRVKDLLGNVSSCVLIGEVEGDVMRQGDLVRVTGAKDRHGLVTTHKVHVLDHVDGPPRLTIQTASGGSLRIARALDLFAKLVALAMTLCALVLVLGAV